MPNFKTLSSTTSKYAWLILGLLACVWGSSFILMKKAMYPVSEEMVLGPFQVGSLRIVFASLALLPFALKHLRKLNKKNWYWLLVVGGCGNLLPAMLFTLAETRIDSSLAGILNMGTSFFVVIIGVIFYKLKPTKFQFLGITLGSLGLFLLLRKQLEVSGDDVYYAMWIIIATLCYAISVTTIKYKVPQLPAIAITSLSFMIILLPALVISLSFDSFNTILSHPDGFNATGYLLILSLIGTAFAVALFTKLVEVSSAVFASGVTYLIPVVAVFIGVLSGDSYELIQILWAAFIIMGVFLMNKSRKNLSEQGNYKN